LNNYVCIVYYNCHTIIIIFNQMEISMNTENQEKKEWKEPEFKVLTIDETMSGVIPHTFEGGAYGS